MLLQADMDGCLFEPCGAAGVAAADPPTWAGHCGALDGRADILTSEAAPRPGPRAAPRRPRPQPSPRRTKPTNKPKRARRPHEPSLGGAGPLAADVRSAPLAVSPADAYMIQDGGHAEPVAELSALNSEAAAEGFTSMPSGAVASVFVSVCLLAFFGAFVLGMRRRRRLASPQRSI